jgi:hypothetical protein
MTKYLNAFVQETFEVNGEEKSNYTKVGVAFRPTSGIPPKCIKVG